MQSRGNLTYARARRLGVLAILLTPVTILGANSGVSVRASADALVALPNSVPSQALITQSAQPSAGVANQAQAVSISLIPRNAGLLDNLTAGKQVAHLSDIQIQSLFSPAQATYQAMSNYLIGQGLHVTLTDPFRILLTVSGTRPQLDAAFHTTSIYGRNKLGDAGFLNTTPLMLPASLASATQAVVGMENVTRLHPNFVRPKGDVGPQPNSNSAVCGAPVQGHVFCGADDPISYRAGYNVPDWHVLGGQGVKVGITSASIPDVDGIAAWNANYATASPTFPDPFPPITYTVVGPPLLNGASTEADLDVTNVHTVAPYASITLYNAANGGTFQDFLQMHYRAMLDGMNVVSESYSICDIGTINNWLRTINKAGHAIFQLAMLKGINYLVSTGDSGVYCTNIFGDFTTDTGLANSSGDDTLALAIGGTEVTFDANNNYSYVGETGFWSAGAFTCVAGGDPFNCLQVGSGSSGGGIAPEGQTGPLAGEAQPSFQVGLIPNPASVTPNTSPPFDPAIAPFYNKNRAIPDISSNGSPKTALIVGVPGGNTGFGLFRVGGTSESTPWTAGILALATQQHGRNIGRANALIYAGCAAHASWCYDVTTGFNGTSAQAGWDYVTGLGTIKDVSAFVSQF